MTIIQESDGTNPRGSIEFDEYERNDYVRRFLDIFTADIEEHEMCARAYEIHLELRSRYDLYIAVADKLEAKHRRALHVYAQCRGVLPE